MQPLPQEYLPTGVRSRFVHDVNGATFHILESGHETPDRPLVLLIHGFPELAYSWRKIMVPLAEAGYHVIAPDVRGYGRTSGADVKYNDDLRPFSALNKIHDMLGLVMALGYQNVAAVIGHDQGSPLAGWCALTRPDVFNAVVMMSSPFRGGPESLPFNTANVPAAPAKPLTINEDMAKYSAAHTTSALSAMSARSAHSIIQSLRWLSWSSVGDHQLRLLLRLDIARAFLALLCQPAIENLIDELGDGFAG